MSSSETQTPEVKTEAATPLAVVKTSIAQQMAAIEKRILRSDMPDFRPGDTVRVHAKIVEGTKERIQVFEGVVLKRHRSNNSSATFTVRKVSYNVGVERTFFFNSPRVDKVEIVTHGDVRRAKLFYLRPLRGKSARIKSRYVANQATQTSQGAAQAEAAAPEAAAE